MINCIFRVFYKKLLLDKNRDAAAAYSLRKLRKGYTGACIRVRRSSDNTEQDIGFSENILDIATLLSFVGINNGFITTWYDQSGNNRNISNTTSTAQPRIVNAGVLETINNKPAAYFNGSNGLFLDSAFLYNAGQMQAYILGKISTNLQRYLFSEAYSISSSPIYLPLGSPSTTDGSKNNGGLIRNDMNVNILAQTIGTLNFYNNNAGQFTAIDSGSSLRCFLNSLLDTDRTYSRAMNTLTLNRFCLGSVYRSSVTSPAVGHIVEAIFYADNSQINNQNSIEKNQQKYLGI